MKDSKLYFIAGNLCVNYSSVEIVQINLVEHTRKLIFQSNSPTDK